MIKCNKIIGKDKGCHFIAGFIIALLPILFGLSFSVFGVLITSPTIAISFGVVAGVGKEVRDFLSYGGFDFFDMFATIIGSVAFLFLYVIFSLII